MNIDEETVKFLKSLKPLRAETDTEKAKKIKRTCGNCKDLIICWAAGKFENEDDEDDSEEKETDCPDWRMNFMKYQELF